MRHDALSTLGPSEETDVSPAPPTGRVRLSSSARVGRWAVGMLIVATSVAAGLTLSWWVVPPYWALMTWLLWPGREGRARLPERPVDSCDFQDLEVSADLTTNSPTIESTPAPKARRGRARAKAVVTEVAPPLDVSWVQVAPGKFVRVEQGASATVPTITIGPSPSIDDTPVVMTDPTPIDEGPSVEPRLAGPPSQEEELGFEPPLRPDEPDRPEVCESPPPNGNGAAAQSEAIAEPEPENDEQGGDVAAETERVETNQEQTSDGPSSTGGPPVPSNAPPVVAGIAPDAVVSMARRAGGGLTLRPNWSGRMVGALVRAGSIPDPTAKECRARHRHLDNPMHSHGSSVPRAVPDRSLLLTRLARAPPRHGV